jgi:hypothetical protein
MSSTRPIVDLAQHMGRPEPGGLSINVMIPNQFFVFRVD